MPVLDLHIHVDADGRVTGTAPRGLPPGDYDVVVEAAKPMPRPDPKAALANIRRLQEEIARMPVLDPRSPEEILADDDTGMPRAW